MHNRLYLSIAFPRFAATAAPLRLYSTEAPLIVLAKAIKMRETSKAMSFAQHLLRGLS